MAEVNMDVSEGAKNDPFTIMSESVRDKTKIVISCRNNHKLVGSLKAYDHHCNMILEEVKDIWSEPIKNGKGEVVDTNARERYIHKMFLRGDTVVVVMKFEITDPSTYNKRDLLLVLQLLHTEGLIDPSAINAKPSILKDISYNWFNHKSTKLSMMNGLDIGKQWTIGQLVELYNNLLAEYPNCSNTTDLANTIYAERVEELERKLEDSQQQFEDLINE